MRNNLLMCLNTIRSFLCQQYGLLIVNFFQLKNSKRTQSFNNNNKINLYPHKSSFKKYTLFCTVISVIATFT